MRNVRKAHVVLVLFNGHAGWAEQHGEIGICHGELQAALDSGAGRVRIIGLRPEFPLKPSDRDRRFREYVTSLRVFQSFASTGEQVIQHALASLHDATVDLINRGIAEARRGKPFLGESLSWNQLSFSERKARMESELRDALLARAGSKRRGNDAVLRLGDKNVLCVPHGIPAAVSVPAARELVGRPHLNDHEKAAELGQRRVGPVHVIACQKTATETQAASILGFPGATIVATPFGVYVADNIQKMQLVCIRECRDASTTRDGVRRLFEWLEQSGELERLLARAVSRTRIVTAIAKELA